MAVRSAPESFHSVTLSFDGQAYTANIWRGSAVAWRLLSVEVHGMARVQADSRVFGSCRGSLEAAEQLVRDAVRNRLRDGAA